MPRVMFRFISRFLIFIVLSFAGQAAHAADNLTIAAASDLKFALEEIIVLFKHTHPSAQIATVYGSSGKLSTQIRLGAPYDIFFSADIAYPRELHQAGLSASPVYSYGVGHIVIWSASLATREVSLSDLADPRISKIALANPKHAPYGKRAKEALTATGMWDKIVHKLVYGENVAQAAQFVQTGNAQIGIIALSLARSPALIGQGSYTLIPGNLHQPLEQGFIITQRAATNILAPAFAQFFSAQPAQQILQRYGFDLPSPLKSRLN